MYETKEDIKKDDPNKPETKAPGDKPGKTPDNKGNKGKQGNRHRRKRGDNRNKPEDKKGSNDPNWYAVSEQIGKDTASIPYNVFAGTRVQNFSSALPTEGFTLGDQSFQTVPSFMAVQYVPTPGKSNNANAAVNVAARAIYSWVRHQNSGSKNYEAVDLMLYILAMDSIYLQIMEAKRIYKAAVTYSYLNRAIPDGLLYLLNVNADDVRENLAQFRAGINLRIAKLSALCVPQAFDLFKRHALISSYIYADSDSDRAQFYAMVAGGYWKFNPTESATGGKLDFVVTTTPRTVSQILSNIDDALDVLLKDEDINTMSGDILKAYGRESLYAIPELHDNEAIEFIYDEGLLNQIENASTVNARTGLTIPSITQNNGQVYFNPTIPLQANEQDSAIASRMAAGVWLNSHKKDPDWKDNLEFTRLITIIDTDSLDGEFVGTAELLFGSEIVMGFYIVAFDYAAGAAAAYAKKSVSTDMFMMSGSPDVSVPLVSVAVTEASKFDWHPQINLWYVTGTLGLTDYCGVAMDLKVFTRLKPADIRRLHDTAIMGEFKTQLITSK